MLLNLVDPNKSEVKYKISKFPDGQQSLDIQIESSPDIFDQHVRIWSRLNSFKDLELIICANQVLKSLNSRSVSLYVPYFLGARSDRKFQEGGVNYLKQVICPIINSQNFSKVTVIDPHSDVLEACLNNYSKVNNIPLVDDALSYLIKDGEEDQICLVSPDAGAYKKIFDVAKYFNIKRIATANKVRDLSSGLIVATEIPNLPCRITGDDYKYVIVDDICDGGRTFIELAKVIKEQRPGAEIYLIVTHGIFSAGFSELNKYFDGIFTTNSVKDIGDVEADSMGNLHPTNVKQLNVFNVPRNKW